MSSLRIALVEDDPKTRKRLAAALAGVPGIEVVVALQNAEEALAWMKPGAVVGHPGVDLMVVDLMLPGMNGIELVESLCAAFAEVRFLMLTLHEDRHWIFNALRAGASGYVAKGCPLEDLVDAIHKAHAGGMPFSIGVARRVREHFMSMPVSAPENQLLSPRELDVLTALARGRLLKEVAEELGLSPHTVRTYLKRIYAKLKVRSSREAVGRFLGPSNTDGRHR